MLALFALLIRDGWNHELASNDGLYGINASDGPTFYSIRVGTLAQREDLAPVAQVWARSSVGWLETIPDLHRIETQ